MKRLALLLTLLIPVFTFSQIINIPDDYPTIQQGIEAAVNGDTVLVETGTYYENINFSGKAITVASHYLIDNDSLFIINTIIDGSQLDTTPVVTLNSGEDTTSIIFGFTITGGTGLYVEEFDMILGGGIATSSAGVKVLHNKIIENEINHSGYAGGGGIGCVSENDENWLVARYNVISRNNSYSDGIEAYGGGVFSGTNLIFEDNEVFENTCTGINTAEANGGAILLGSQSRTLIYYIRNNFLHDNTCDGNTVVGAGVIIWYSEGTVSGNEIWHNTGTAVNAAQGGGLILNSTTGEINIIDNDFLGNILIGNDLQGGGIQIAQANHKVNIENNSFEENTLNGSNEAKGGGIMLIQNHEVLINNNFFQANVLNGTTNFGAGISGAFPMEKTEIRNNTFSSNSNTGTGEGGGIHFWNAKNIRLEFDGNNFKNNSAGSGGGLYTYNCYNILLSNNIFSGNDATEMGGGCRLRHFETTQSEHHPFIINNTFVNNTSSEGGAIYCDHQDEFPLIVNSIFWGNEASIGNDIYYSGSENMIISYSDINPDNIAGLWEGEENIAEDPLFIDPTNGDFHLNNCESPCINAGVDSLEIVAIWYYCPTTDFDIEARPAFNTSPDMGADETPCLNTSIKENENLLSSSVINCFPNPFSTSTTIEYELNQPETVRITFYNSFGRVVDIIEEHQSQGLQKAVWTPKNLADRIYYFRLQSGEQIESGKLVFVK